MADNISTVQDVQLPLDDVGQPTFNIVEAKLGLAKYILIALVALVLLVYGTSFLPDEYINERARKFAENIYQGVVPIASMVIGYYFGKD